MTTIQCQDHFDACGIMVEYLKSIGVPPETIIRHAKDISSGKIVVSRDRLGKRPWVSVMSGSVRWSTVRMAMGL